MGWGRRRLHQRPGLTIEFCLILLSRGLNRPGVSHYNPQVEGFYCCRERLWGVPGRPLMRVSA